MFLIEKQVEQAVLQISPHRRAEVSFHFSSMRKGESGGGRQWGDQMMMNGEGFCTKNRLAAV